ATLQLGDASRVALRAGVPTITDFRSANIAAGGEGAPLVPFADFVLFGTRAPVALLNLGGIANLTLIPRAEADSVIAFDTGRAHGRRRAQARDARRHDLARAHRRGRRRAQPDARERTAGSGRSDAGANERRARDSGHRSRSGGLCDPRRLPHAGKTEHPPQSDRRIACGLGRSDPPTLMTGPLVVGI